MRLLYEMVRLSYTTHWHIRRNVRYIMTVYGNNSVQNNYNKVTTTPSIDAVQPTNSGVPKGGTKGLYPKNYHALYLKGDRTAGATSSQSGKYIITIKMKGGAVVPRVERWTYDQ